MGVIIFYFYVHINIFYIFRHETFASMQLRVCCLQNFISMNENICQLSDIVAEAVNISTNWNIIISKQQLHDPFIDVMTYL